MQINTKKQSNGKYRGVLSFVGAKRGECYLWIGVKYMVWDCPTRYLARKKAGEYIKSMHLEGLGMVGTELFQSRLDESTNPRELIGRSVEEKFEELS